MQASAKNSPLEIVLELCPALEFFECETICQVSDKVIRSAEKMANYSQVRRIDFRAIRPLHAAGDKQEVIAATVGQHQRETALFVCTRITSAQLSNAAEAAVIFVRWRVQRTKTRTGDSVVGLIIRLIITFGQNNYHCIVVGTSRTSRGFESQMSFQ